MSPAQAFEDDYEFEDDGPLRAADFDDLAAGEVREAALVERADRRTRFFVSAMDSPDSASEADPAGALYVSAAGAPRGRLRRCVLTPVATVDVQDNLQRVPKGKVKTADKAANVATYEIFAGDEARHIKGNYAEWGAVEVAEMLGQEKEILRALKVTQAFFPAYPRVPALLVPNPDAPDAPSVAGAVAEALALIGRGEHPLQAAAGHPLNSPQYRPYYFAVGKALIESARVADRKCRAIISATETAITLDPKDPRFKVGYDPLDELCFERTGLVKKKEVLNRLADERLRPQAAQPVQIVQAAPVESAALPQLTEAITRMAEQHNLTIEAVSGAIREGLKDAVKDAVKEVVAAGGQGSQPQGEGKKKNG